jgi:hypothetical protein
MISAMNTSSWPRFEWHDETPVHYGRCCGVHMSPQDDIPIFAGVVEISDSPLWHNQFPGRVISREPDEWW